MVKAEIVEKIKKFIEVIERQNIKVAKAIIYGSQVSGKMHEYSDIDVAIVSSDFGNDRYEEGTKLFELACEVDPRIEPVPISLRSYEEDTWVPLIYEIRTKGVEIS